GPQPTPVPAPGAPPKKPKPLRPRPKRLDDSAAPTPPPPPVAAYSTAHPSIDNSPPKVSSKSALHKPQRPRVINSNACPSGCENARPSKKSARPTSTSGQP